MQIPFGINVNGVSVEPSLIWSPVVNGLHLRRSGNTLIFTSEAEGYEVSADELTYTWSFSGTDGVDFITNDTNPATLSPYTESVAGMVTVTVTDGNVNGGTTIVDYPLNAGAFPDGVVKDNIDSEAPMEAFITINNGDISTSTSQVTLNISASDNFGVTAYYASENDATPDASADEWTAVTESADYTGNVAFT